MKFAGWLINYDQKGNVLYITSPDNRPADAIDNGDGVIWRYAKDDGHLVGITLVNTPFGMKLPTPQRKP